MPSHSEERILPYHSNDLFNLVADVEKYPDFLPWCQSVRITGQGEKLQIADMVIGFRGIREQFTSKVILDRESLCIEAQYLNGPFKHMQSHWTFAAHHEGTSLGFYVDFEFRSKILATLATPAFGQAVQKMVRSFEKRAEDLCPRFHS